MVLPAIIDKSFVVVLVFSTTAKVFASRGKINAEFAESAEIRRGNFKICFFKNSAIPLPWRKLFFFPFLDIIWNLVLEHLVLDLIRLAKLLHIFL